MKNMKLSFIFTFQAVLILIVLIVTSAYSVNTMTHIDEDYYAVFYANDDIATAGLDMSSATTALRLACTRFMLTEGADAEQYHNFEIYTAQVQNNIDLSRKLVYESTLSDAGKSEILDTLDETEMYREKQETLINNYMNYLNGNGYVDVDDIFYEVNITGAAIFGNIATVNSQTTRLFTEMIEDIKIEVITSKLFLTLLSVAIMSVIMILMTLISKNIKSSLNKLKESSSQLAKGNLHIDVAMEGSNEIAELSHEMAHMAKVVISITDDISNMSKELNDGNLSTYAINDENYDGEFKNVVAGINMTVGNLINENGEIIDALDNFSKGHFDIKITDLPGEKHRTTKALTIVKSALIEFTDKILNVVSQIKAGKVDEVIETDGFVGDWLTMCNGLSDLLVCVKEPLNDMQEIFEEFAKGNFDFKNEKEYEGIFKDIQGVANSTSLTMGNYINEISHILNEMANKNFDVKMTQNYVGDFEKIESSIEFIISNLTSLIKDILVTSEQVSIGVRQISDTSMDLAEGSTDQAGSVELLNANIRSINEQAIENQANSESASILSLDTKENVNTGTVKMKTMLSAMEEINIASNSISNIIKVIDDIAFQTNILALNAAVEAARAGEHGKGFAVVAEEVRSLAGRSQHAAKETTDLIESTVSKVEEGSKIANETSDSLDNIVSQIEEVTTIINKVKALSIEQGNSIQDVTKEVGIISNVTQRNTANSEELASSSEELSAMAEIMFKTVSTFNLKKE